MDARAMMPALRCGSVPAPWNSTCAWMMKSPFIMRYANWNSSRLPQMFSPPALSVYTCDAAFQVEWPAIGRSLRERRQRQRERQIDPLHDSPSRVWIVRAPMLANGDMPRLLGNG